MAKTAKKKAPAYRWDFWEHGVTQGAINAFLTCREKARLSLQEGLTPISRDRGALIFGNLVHGVLEQLHHSKEYKPKAQALKLARKLVGAQEEKMRPTIASDQLQEFEQLAGMAEALTVGYITHWADKDTKDMNWQQSEAVFSVPWTLSSGRKTVLRGKMDGVFRRGKRLWLFETKTKSQVREDVLIDTIPLDLQVAAYLEAIRVSTGETPQGALYNVLRRPGLRLGAKETIKAFTDRCMEDVLTRPEHYFIRFEVALTKDELEQSRLELDNILDEMERWAMGEGHFRSACHCAGMWGPCDFLPICARQDRGRFAVKEAHFPELEEAE